VRIGLLGPLHVYADNSLIAIPASKHRSLLAALAVRPGEALPADALAEAWWDHAPPPSWRGTLRNYVKRLRSALGGEAGDPDVPLLTKPAGYLLAVDRGQVDLLRFESLCKDGHAAGQSGDWRRAADMLAAAGRLWRGTPFADVPSRVIRDEHLPYLEEMRLSALETRVEADLRLSPCRAAGLIPELGRLTVRHPERERLRAHFMLALYRCGRRGDALRTYQECRTYEVAEFGIEPGPELQALHCRILAADPALMLGARERTLRDTRALQARDGSGRC
jgi:DNA-binding SARP family transcriptional activator